MCWGAHCVWVHVHKCACGCGGHRLMLSIFLHYLSSFVSRQGLLLTLELISWLWLVQLFSLL